MADFLKLIQTCSDCKNDNILNRLVINNSKFYFLHTTHNVRGKTE